IGMHRDVVVERLGGEDLRLFARIGATQHDIDLLSGEHRESGESVALDIHPRSSPPELPVERQTYSSGVHRTFVPSSSLLQAGIASASIAGALAITTLRPRRGSA